MIDHVSLQVTDMAVSKAFYEVVLAPLGMQAKTPDGHVNWPAVQRYTGLRISMGTRSRRLSFFVRMASKLKESRIPIGGVKTVPCDQAASRAECSVRDHMLLVGSVIRGANSRIQWP